MPGTTVGGTGAWLSDCDIEIDTEIERLYQWSYTLGRGKPSVSEAFRTVDRGAVVLSPHPSYDRGPGGVRDHSNKLFRLRQP